MLQKNCGANRLCRCSKAAQSESYIPEYGSKSSRQRAAKQQHNKLITIITQITPNNGPQKSKTILKFFTTHNRNRAISVPRFSAVVKTTAICSCCSAISKFLHSCDALCLLDLSLVRIKFYSLEGLCLIKRCFLL